MCSGRNKVVSELIKEKKSLAKYKNKLENSRLADSSFYLMSKFDFYTFY